MNSRRKELDWLLTGLALMASLLGLVAVATASLVPDASLFYGIPTDAVKQAALLVAAIGLFFLAKVLPPVWVKACLWLFYFVGLAGVILTFGPLGAEINGQKLWLDVGLGMKFQPSEFLKAAAIVLAGILFATRGEEPRLERIPQTMGQVFTYFLGPQLRHRMAYGVGMTAAFAVILQKDMGTAAVIVASLLVMHLVSGASLKRVAAVAVCLALVAGIFLFKSDYRAARIPNWLHRWEKGVREAGGFQQTTSEAGISRGGLWGVGLTRGKAKEELPVGTSDFVMTTVAEETGLWGVTLIFVTLGGLSLVMMLRTMEGSGVATVAWTGVGTWILSQTFVNMGMANAFLPAIGLPMPFVSTGGSTLIAIWASLGALMSLSAMAVPAPKTAPAPREEREVRGYRRITERAAPAPNSYRLQRRYGHETRPDGRRHGRPRLSRP